MYDRLYLILVLLSEQNQNPIITSDTPCMKENSTSLGFVAFIGFVFKIYTNVITG